MPLSSPASGGARSVSVVVPASSANVGCAFDCAAIALNLYLRVSAIGSSSKNDFGFDVDYRGPNADEIPRDGSNLIVKAMQRFAARAKVTLPGARILIENEIPLSIGLGSSAAAVVAGILLGAELCGIHLGAADALQFAQEFEGHPDNVSASIYGGMVVALVADALPGEAQVLVSKAEVSQDLDFVAVIPNVPLPTEKARAVLPAQYSRADAVANLQRTALLTAFFFSGKNPSLTLTPELFCDRLHQPYRSPLVPGIAECLAFRHEGLAGVFLSGAGSAVMAIVHNNAGENANQGGSENAKAIGEALVGEFRRKGVAARALLLKADNRGAQISNASGERTLAARGAAPRS